MVKPTVEHGITSFSDATLVERHKTQSAKDNFPLVYPLADYTARAMLTRPQFFKTITWNAAYLGENIEFPSVALYNLFADYIKYFEFIRTSWRVQFRFNSTPFQQGSLMVGFLPYQTTTLYTNSDVRTVSMMDSVYITLAGERQIDYIIPYKVPTAAMDIAGVTEGTQGTLFIRPLTVFRSVQSAPASVKLNVWISMEDPYLYGFAQSDSSATVINQQQLFSQASNDLKVDSGAIQTAFEQQQAKEASAKNDNILEKVLITGGSNILKAVPYVGPVWNAIANFLNENTFSKPLTSTAAQPLINYPLRSATTIDGSITAEPISGQFSATLHPYDLPGFNGDRSVNDIAMQPAVYQRQTFADTDVGTTFTIQAHPWFGATFSNTKFHHDYLSYVTSAFTTWRGSIRLKMLVVTNAVTSGRLLLTYATKGVPSDSGNFVQQIVEFKGETSYNFTIPYIDKYYWRKTSPPSDSDILKTSVRVKLLDMISSDVSTTNYIDIVIFRAAGPDIQFSGLRTPLLSNDGFPAVSGQSNNIRTIFAKETFPMMVTTNNEMSSSFKIGVEYGMCNTEHPYNPQQLVKRPGRVLNNTPMILGTSDASVFSTYDRAPFRYWANLFNFWRGGITTMATNTVLHHQFDTRPEFGTNHNDAPAYYPPTQTGFEHYTIPYIGEIPFSGMWRAVGVGIEEHFNLPAATDTGFGNILYQSGADDIQMFHLIPPLIYPYIPPPLSSASSSQPENEQLSFASTKASLKPIIDPKWNSSK